MRHQSALLRCSFATLSSACIAGVVAQERSSDVFDLGELVVIGERPDGLSSVSGSVINNEMMWQFEKPTLDLALNLTPGVVSTRAGGGQRNEFDIFVRGFGRWQVPLMVDGVRIYLPADNRIDFARFLTADVAEVQVQKGYASVLDGPGAMGGAINLVTTSPTESFQADAGVSFGGAGSAQSTNAFVVLGSRQDSFYVQGSIAYLDRDSWTMSDDYVSPPNSFEDGGERLGSDTRDRRLSFKVGFTPNDTNEYTINYMRQEGEKGAPLNVYNNPPVPQGSYWRWPYWDVQNLSFLSTTQIGGESYLKAKVYYNTFENLLEGYDDITYTTQSLPRGFHSPYDDQAYGTGLEYGTTRFDSNTLKLAFYYRVDEHSEYSINQPTHPTARFVEPEQNNALETWSIAAENTFHLNSEMDIVAGVSHEEYEVTEALDYDPTLPTCRGPDDTALGLIQCPLGGADAFNWQTAFIWRYSSSAQFHASISNRARFPTVFELYSQGFGTREPNPDLGPESATNVEVGWEKSMSGGARIGGAIFYSDVKDLIQSVILPSTRTQQQNVGDGRFYGLEVSGDVRLTDSLRLGGNYTFIDREITDALNPNLRPTGVPPHKLFFYAEWQPAERLSITPSVEATTDRWSDVNTSPAPAFPYIETGAAQLVSLDVKYRFPNNLELAGGAQNLLDENYELAWGYPQQGRSYYLKTRVAF